MTSVLVSSHSVGGVRSDGAYNADLHGSADQTEAGGNPTAGGKSRVQGRGEVSQEGGEGWDCGAVWLSLERTGPHIEEGWGQSVGRGSMAMSCIQRREKLL